MIHYHGTPITPKAILQDLAGRNFCVSYADPRQVQGCHEIGQSVMLDNGAYTRWRLNPGCYTFTWDGFYEWVRPWLDYPTTWCVIPDVIEGREVENDRLLGKWFAVMGHYRQAAPVWHLHESLERLERLVIGWDKVCIGSSGEYALISSDRWNNRMNEAFNRVCRGSGRPPCWLHMLRGMSLTGSIYPFASADSTDVARNHLQVPGRAAEMAQRWDVVQCPARWVEQPLQTVMAL